MVMHAVALGPTRAGQLLQLLEYWEPDVTCARPSPQSGPHTAALPGRRVDPILRVLPSMDPFAFPTQSYLPIFRPLDEGTILPHPLAHPR